MIVHRRRLLHAVLPSGVVNENIINRVENCKFLGIIMDDHIIFKSHVELTLGKLAKYLYIFIQNSQLRSNQRICASLSSFHLWCECVGWGGCYVTTIKPSKTLQNRLMRAIAGADYRASAEPIYRRFRL